jgi:carotenoid cleavage dioxygenase
LFELAGASGSLRSLEPGRIADDRVGRRNRYSYLVSFHYEAEPERSAHYRYDSVTGRRYSYRLPEGTTCGEPVFVRRGPVEEDDGHLLALAHDRVRGSSSLLVLEAGDIAAGPVAEVRLPVRVPAGFHGSWISSR